MITIPPLRFQTVNLCSPRDLQSCVRLPLGLDVYTRLWIVARVVNMQHIFFVFPLAWDLSLTPSLERDGENDPHNRDVLIDDPILSERAFKLTGIPYIKDQATIKQTTVTV